MSLLERLEKQKTQNAQQPAEAAAEPAAGNVKGGIKSKCVLCG